MKNKPLDSYQSGDYLKNNPTWDQEDSPWKAKQVVKILHQHHVQPQTVCEVGCGAGAVLGALHVIQPNVQYTGYDISPDAESFWRPFQQQGIQLHVGDFFQCQQSHYDVILLLDVLEHVADPHQFLQDLKPYAPHVVIHFPLDLSALSVLRESPLLYVRRKVGHIHYFSKGLALELLEECGYEIVDAQYTGAARSAPQRSMKTKCFSYVRQLLSFFQKDIAVRLLGGETLIVLARPKENTSLHD